MLIRYLRQYVTLHIIIKPRNWKESIYVYIYIYIMANNNVLLLITRCCCSNIEFIDILLKFLI